MACKYYYKGHLFNTELELDDFLIENAENESVLGDIVFSLTTPLNHALKRLLQVGLANRTVRQKAAEYRRTHIIQYDNYGEENIEVPPYVGVNKFLSMYEDENGKKLFPEFIEENYWDNRFNDWAQGKYNETEREVFGLSNDPATWPKLTASDKDSKGNIIREVYKQKIKDKWNIQGLIGNTIHNILQLCFKREGNGFIVDWDAARIDAYVRQHIEDKNRLFLKDDAILDTIAYAKLLHKDLKQKFGRDSEGNPADLMYFPEFLLSSQGTAPDGKLVQLMGVIDLLIIDPQGHAHLLDYKTSIHDYVDFNKAKETAFKYLLATYLRMLEVSSINIYDGQLMVSPIQIKGFRPEGDTYTYDTISYPMTFDVLNPRMTNQRMWDQLDTYLPKPDNITIDPANISLNVTEMMAKWFPKYSSTRTADKESVMRELQQRKLDKPDENGNFTYYRPTSEGGNIVTNDKADFINQVLAYKNKLGPRRIRLTSTIKNALKDGVVNGINPSNFPTARWSKDEEESATWLTDIVAKYGDGNWDVIDNDILEQYGIITIRTKNGLKNQVDFIRVSTDYLKGHYKDSESRKETDFNSHKSIVGNFVSDVVEGSKSNSLILQATKGNVELIEMMLILNQTAGFENYVVGNMSVINPDQGNGMQASNEELFYNFEELNKYAPVTNDSFKNGRIKLATRYELAQREFNRIMNKANREQFKGLYNGLRALSNDATSLLDDCIDGSAEDKIVALQKLLDYLQRNDFVRQKLSKVYTDSTNLADPYVLLHNDILLAIAQLRGIDFRLLLDEHDKWLESVFVWKEGASGSYIDNPGNLNSETLNLVTKLATEAYQNVRDEVLRERPKILKLVENLKKELQFNGLKQATFGNQVTNLYKHMTKIDDNGDFVFVDPDTLSSKAERDFLEYVMLKVNLDRWGKTESELKTMRDNKSLDYFRVPICRGGADSLSSNRGLLAAFRQKIDYLLHPSKAILAARDKLEGVVNAETSTTKQESRLLFQMTNMFDGTKETESRMRTIERIGVDNLEYNLETILYKHIFAHSVLRNMNLVFPSIKAAMVHLATLGNTQNTKFEEDLLYFREYIKNKIFNESIVAPNRLELAQSLGILRRAASFATLVFSPVQALYQPLQGLWQDVSLMIRKPDGKESFTFSHFKKALKLAYSDLFEFSEHPTLCQLLNETYALNDMDMNQYVERLSTAKRGIFWNFENFAYKFASRPDFYNRMTIWLSQMMGDGCLEAHKVVNDRLVYDWKLDKRFSKFAANPKSNSTDPEFLKQKMLYLAMALLFVREGARDENGDLFLLNMADPKPLPRAYTNLESEGMKSLADDIYGYYSHEKKSLVMSTFIGSMWLQFKTYWSGKKNQYLQKGGVRLRGEWTHYGEPMRDENNQVIIDPQTGLAKEVKYYYQTDDLGNVLFNEPPLAENDPNLKNKLAPFMTWKGRWLEGIILTMNDMIKESLEKGSIVAGFKAKWNDPDPMMRRVYRSNIKQLGYDFTMYMLLGNLLASLLMGMINGWEKEYKKNPTLAEALLLTCGKIGVKALTNSAMDLNIADSVGAPLVEWSPFATEYGLRQFKNWANVAMGDEDFWDGVVKTTSVGKQMKPLLDYIKPDIFKTDNELLHSR